MILHHKPNETAAQMINLAIQTQPDDETCGPTCLHAIYRHYGFDISLETVIQGVERSLSGGTLGPLLGKHALLHQFSATIYVNNLDVFDPSWFEQGEASRDALCAKLDAQMRYKWDKGLIQTSIAYQQFLQAGGRVRFRTLSMQLLQYYFKQQKPILTGLSATYLYRSARETYSSAGVACYDDIRGTPCGHFVILCGSDAEKKHIVVADPHRENPLSHDNYYKVDRNRLINAILLGVYTDDANLLIIQPK